MHTFLAEVSHPKIQGPILKFGQNSPQGGAVHTFLKKGLKSAIPFWPKKCAPLHPVAKMTIFQSRSLNAKLAVTSALNVT